MVVKYKVGDKVRFIKFDNWTKVNGIEASNTYTVTDIAKDLNGEQLIGIEINGRRPSLFFWNYFVTKERLIKRDIPWL